MFTHTVLPACLYCSRRGTVEGNVKLGGKPCRAKHSIGVMRRMPNLSLMTGTRFGYVPILALSVAVFARLYAVIGKAIELLIVPNGCDHLIVPAITGMKVKGFFRFLRGIDDVGDPPRQRLFVGESKSPALLIIAKSHQIGAGTVLRNICIFASICHKIAQEVIAPRKLLMDDIKRPAAVVFDKVCDVLQKDDGRMFRIDRLSDLEEYVAARIGKALLLAAHGKRLTRKTCGKDIKIGYGRLVHLLNIALDQRNVRKVVAIGHTGVLIFIVRPYDGMPRLLQHQIDAADPAKEAANSHVNGLRN